MRIGGRRWLAGAAVALLAAACSSSSTDSAEETEGTGSPERSAGPVRGVTDDTIRISVIAADFGVLVEQGLAPELGDQPAVFRALADKVNEEGGIAGRQLEVNVHIVEGVPIAETAQAACLKATEEDDPFAVIISPAIIEEAVRCVAVQHETVVVSGEGWNQELYDSAEGRLFSAGSHISMSVERLFRAWATVAHDVGVLEDKTIGVVVTDQDLLVAGVDNGLEPELEDLDYEVAAKAVLPCPEGSQTCTQHETAVQRMKDAGVDLVFMSADVLAGSAFVQAAIDLDFHPEWTANRRQVTDTVAKFFEGVSEEWDGALGVSTLFPADEISEEAEACNELVSDQPELRYERGSDAYGFTANNCIALQLLQEAVESMEGPIDQAALIEALESIAEVPSNAGPPGSWGPDKHDAGDYVFTSRYDAAESVFVPEDLTPRRID